MILDPEAGKKGISAFLVPTDTPGYVVDKVEHKFGQAASDTCAPPLEDCFVAEELLLGAEGRGYPIALSDLKAGLPCLKEASTAKLFASEAAEAICSGAIQTPGGYGYLEEYRLAKLYRDVEIYEGTSDIQHMVIARTL